MAVDVINVATIIATVVVIVELAIISNLESKLATFLNFFSLEASLLSYFSLVVIFRAALSC